MSNRNPLGDEKFETIQPELPRVSPGGGLAGQWKREPGDFRVEEVRPEPLTGEGHHWVFTIEKTGQTTDFVTRWLAESCGFKKREIGYAGLKDRQAVAIQDFSVPATGKEPLPDLAALVPEGVRILHVGRHRRKIRVGHLTGNRFKILVRGEFIDADIRQRAEAAMTWIARHGVPNWFGPQRFGWGGGNVAAGLDVLARGREATRRMDRLQRGLMLSAVRSEMFNVVLQRRVAGGWFTTLLDGDIAQLDGKSACFPVAVAGAEAERFVAGAIHPTGPLFGSGMMTPTGIPGELEAGVVAERGEVFEQMVAFGLEGARRAVRIIPREFSWEWCGEGVWLFFTLPKGAFATSLLRELMEES